MQEFVLIYFILISYLHISISSYVFAHAGNQRFKNCKLNKLMRQFQRFLELLFFRKIGVI